MNTILRASRVITGQHDLTDAWVHIDDDRILAVGQGDATLEPTEQIEGWLLPGFVDVHVHGGGGGSFSRGEVELAAGFHRQHGTTTMLASLVSEPIDDIIAQVQHLLPFVNNGMVAGIHLEGPFLAARRCGAHDPKLLISPDADTVERVVAAGQGSIKMVTIAPELPGALDAIRLFRDRGIIAALGHSDADGSLAGQAVDAGATQITHLFNGMRPLHHRETGLADVGLLDPRLLCELILDGYHLSHAATEIALRLLGERWIAITDAIAAAGLPDGRFKLGDLDVEAHAGVVRLVEGESLAGSTLTMDAAFRSIMRRFGRSALEAVQATATRPARSLGRSDVGVIAAGARANLLVWREDSLARVMVNGQWIA